MKTDEAKVLCRTPTPGKSPTRIDRAKFNLLRKAILAGLPTKEPGMHFTDLFRLVEERLTPKQAAKIGSIPWYTTTVKLELEVAGEIARVEGSKPQRLVKRKSK